MRIESDNRAVTTRIPVEYAVTDLQRLFSTLIRFEIELWNALDARLRADYALPLSRFEPMQVITSLGSCRVQDIAGALSITVGGASKLVDRLEAAGYCRRHANPADGRSSLIALTPTGQRLLAAASATVEEELRARLSGVLSPQSLDNFHTALVQLRAAGRQFDAASPERRPYMPTTMRAIVLDAPGPPEALTIRDLPIPTPPPGWVLIQVKAFGLNRSEVHTRLGLAQGVTFPRVLGIEAAGVVVACPGGEFTVGQQVAAMMGGMGRTFDGGYAEYTCVPVGQAIPFHSDLDWATLGAVPEMLQTAYGSLTVGLDAQPGQSLLIRGGTSSVGMATAVLAKQRHMTVLSTTRNPSKAAALTAIGVDHVLIDNGAVAGRVRELIAMGVDTALELVGTPTLPDTLRATRLHGVVCFTGMLSNEWTVRDFYPIDYIPRGVRLTAYGGDASDLPPGVLQDFLDAVAAGTAVVPIAHVYRFDQTIEAHAAMEANTASGKLVVTT